MRNRWVLVGLCCWAAAGATEPESAQAVLDCAAANAPEESFEQAARLTVSRNGQVQRHILATFAGQRGQQGFLLNIGVREPADLAGTAILLRQRGEDREDLKLYLPSLRRVRTVTGAMAGQDLLGTDFSYLDIKQVYGAFSTGETRLLEPGRWQERPVHRIELVPMPEEEPVYTRLIVGIDQQDCTPLLIEFEGQKETVVKRLEGDHDSLMQLGQRQLLARYTMKNLEQGSETLLELGDPTFDQRVSRSAFHPNSFYNFHSRADRPEQ